MLQLYWREISYMNLKGIPNSILNGPNWEFVLCETFDGIVKIINHSDIANMAFTENTSSSSVWLHALLILVS